MINQLFGREIDATDDLLHVVHGGGCSHVSVFAGPFGWTIELVDLSAVIGLLGLVVASPKSTPPSLGLAGGHTLQIGVGAERNYVWISAGCVHMRIPLQAANELLAALSEARAHVARAAAAPGKPAQKSGGAPC